MKSTGWEKGGSKEADEIFSASCQKLLQANKSSSDGGDKIEKQLERKKKRKN